MKFLFIVLFYLLIKISLVASENLYSPYSVDLNNLSASRPSSLDEEIQQKERKYLLAGVLTVYLVMQHRYQRKGFKEMSVLLFMALEKDTIKMKLE